MTLLCYDVFRRLSGLTVVVNVVAGSAWLIVDVSVASGAMNQIRWAALSDYRGQPKGAGERRGKEEEEKEGGEGSGRWRD